MVEKIKKNQNLCIQAKVPAKRFSRINKKFVFFSCYDMSYNVDTLLN